MHYNDLNFVRKIYFVAIYVFCGLLRFFRSVFAFASIKLDIVLWDRRDGISLPLVKWRVIFGRPPICWHHATNLASKFNSQTGVRQGQNFWGSALVKLEIESFFFGRLTICWHHATMQLAAMPGIKSQIPDRGQTGANLWGSALIGKTSNPSP